MSTATDFMPGDPALMLTILRSAATGLDQDALLERVLNLFCSDDDGKQILLEDSPELRRRIETASSHLQLAGLISKSIGGRFSITSLGEAMLMAYPMGIDDGVLCSLPAFRNRLYADNAPVVHERPMRNPAYGSGFSAGLGAHRLTENPYPVDSRDHEDWLMGWDEALDQHKRESETLLG
jgi:ribosome modulation factor